MSSDLDRRLFRLIARLHRAGLIDDAELDELLELLGADVPRPRPPRVRSGTELEVVEVAAHARRPWIDRAIPKR